MFLRIYDPRIIAIDLRSRRSGFAIFEGPKRLLDSGTFATPVEHIEKTGAKLSDLVKLSLPQIIVLKNERWVDILSSPQAQPFKHMLTEASETHGIRIRLLSADTISSTFRNLGCETKAEIAAALARIFPDLVWRLPPERKPWESEHPRQSVFDAIALGLVYWLHETHAIMDP